MSPRRSAVTLLSQDLSLAMRLAFCNGAIRIKSPSGGFMLKLRALRLCALSADHGEFDEGELAAREIFEVLGETTTAAE